MRRNASNTPDVLEGLKDITNRPASKSSERSSKNTSFNNQTPKEGKKQKLNNQSESLLSAVAKHSSLSAEEAGKLETPGKMFAHLEAIGELSGEILSLFKNEPAIEKISLTKTYGELYDAAGLPLPRKEARGCIKPLYKGYPRLKVLDCSFVPVADNDLRFITSLAGLEKLNLSNTAITGKGLRHLSKHAAFVSRLSVLLLSNIDGIENTSIESILLFKNLRALSLDGTKVTATGLLPLAETQLTTLLLSKELQDQLRARDLYFAETVSRWAWFPKRKEEVEALSRQEQTKCMATIKKHYREIHINLFLDNEQKICSMLEQRKKERKVCLLLL
ncbi:MAG: uncharacterized protein A8A55_1538 [Amphiamblys sp. WSBS2006]|nr:MAG: uncharacterized protein A8A55_1538 [Amphiamblys sp. WSBS2006]